MRIDEILDQSDGTRFSLEVFPPKARAKQGMKLQQRLSNIFDTIEILMRYDPAFVSVTYNTDNLTKATSIPLAAIIKERFKIETVAHLTCINTPLRELEKTFDVLEYFNISNILALRGDLQPQCPVDSECLRYASDLVRETRSRELGLSIGVACYPEGHPDCINEKGERDLGADRRNLINKINMGADFAITQLFLDNGVFFNMTDHLRKAGVDIPIIPGIMPIINRSNLKVVRNLTGASIPDSLSNRIRDNITDPEEVFEIGVEHAVRQCKELMDNVPSIHFYTMDTWEATDRIIRELI
ncbi:MAG: methylenetetrahydrofolate reductase [Thermoplasmatota archaeon]